MGEKRSNHTVYNVNYHFVWCPKSIKAKLCVHREIFDPAQYRHTILEPIEDSLDESFRDVCDEYNYERLSLHISPDRVHLFLSAHSKWYKRLRRHHENLQFSNDTQRTRLCERLRASWHGRCGNSTSHSC